MKRIKNLFLLCLTLVLFTSVFVKDVKAKSYSFGPTVIDAYIQDDGSMIVEEQWTYQFDGSFSYAFKELPKKGFDSIEIIRIYDKDVIYQQSSYELLDHYVVIEHPNSYEIGWKFNANDETKVFNIQYKLTNVIKKYNDVAELYWQFVGNQIDQRVESVLVNIHFPDQLNKEDVRAFAHGALWGDVTIHDNGMVTLAINDLPANTYVEGRIAFPTQLIHSTEKTYDYNFLDTLLSEEQKLVDQANQRRLLLQVATGLSIILSALIMIYYQKLFFRFKRFTKRHKASFSAPYVRDINSQTSPTKAGVLMNFYKKKDIINDLLSATMMNLVLKHYMSIEFEGSTLLNNNNFEFVNQNKDVNDLDIEERRLMKFLFEKADLDKNGRISITELNKYIKKNGESASDFYDRFEASYQQYLVSLIDKENGQEKTSLQIKMTLSAIIGTILLAIPCFLFLPAIALLVVVGFIMFTQLFYVTTKARRLSKDGEEEYAKWKAFVRFLEDLTLLDKSELPELDKWDEYLVYATALGVADKVRKQLPFAYPQLKDEAYMMSYMPRHMILYSFVNRMPTVTHFGNNISKAASDFKSVNSSKSSNGFGGGFSGGGGFGGGGGGMGAR